MEKLTAGEYCFEAVGNSVMEDVEISLELKNAIQENQYRLIGAIRNHEYLWARRQEQAAAGVIEDPVLEAQFNQAFQALVNVNNELRPLVTQMRHEYRTRQATVKADTVNSATENLRERLSKAITAAKLSLPEEPASVESASPTVPSETEDEARKSPCRSTALEPHHLNPENMTQLDFLSQFGLTTHERFYEMKQELAEKKKRQIRTPRITRRKRGTKWTNRKAHSTRAATSRAAKAKATRKRKIVESSCPATDDNHSDATPQPSTSSACSPQPSTSSACSPQPSTSSRYSPQPSTSSRCSPQPSTSSGCRGFGVSPPTKILIRATYGNKTGSVAKPFIDSPAQEPTREDVEDEGDISQLTPK